jgi:hypothetical protein
MEAEFTALMFKAPGSPANCAMFETAAAFNDHSHVRRMTQRLARTYLDAVVVAHGTASAAERLERGRENARRRSADDRAPGDLLGRGTSEARLFGVIAAGHSRSQTKGSLPIPCSGNVSCSFRFFATILRGAEAPRPRHTYTIEQLKKVVQLSGTSFSHDGRRIIFNSNASGAYNAYVVDTHGGPASPLISSKTSLFAISFFPNDDRVLYTKDDAGDENDHLIVRTPAGHQLHR